MKLIKFYTDTCGPCKCLKPTVDKLVKNHPEIDYEEYECSNGTPDEYAQEIKSVPTLLFINGDSPNIKIVGTRSYEFLEDLLK